MNLDTIIAAHAAAQLAFSRMLAAGTLADPEAWETRAYVAAERRVDAAITDLQGLTAQRETDAVLSDHHVGIGA